MFRVLQTSRKRSHRPGMPQTTQLVLGLLVTVAMLHRCTAEEPGDLHLGNTAERFSKWAPTTFRIPCPEVIELT